MRSCSKRSFSTYRSSARSVRACSSAVRWRSQVEVGEPSVLHRAWGPAGDDDGRRPGRGDKGSEIVRIAGEDAVAGFGEEGDRGVDRVLGSGPRHQHSCGATVRLADRTDVDGRQEARQSHLASSIVAPGLGDHDGVRP